MSSLCCPLCAASVAAVSLEAHLRTELNYTALRCLLCSLEFFSAEEARAHYAGPLPAHPATQPRIAELRDAGQAQRLQQLLAAASPAQPCHQACPCCQRRCAGQPGPFGASPAQPYAAPPTPDQSAEEAAVESKALALADHKAQAQATVVKLPQIHLPLAQVKAEVGTAASETSEADTSGERKLVIADSDGKVACLLCSARIDRSNFTKHAQRNHVASSPFLCNLCPHKAKRKDALQKHLRLHHEVAEATEEHMTILSLKSEVERATEQCFGNVREVETPTVQCKECRTAVKANAKKAHVALRHLKKAVHSCRLCDFTSLHLSSGDMAKHLKTKHGRAFGEDTAESLVDRYEPLVKRMLPELFQ